MHSHSIESWQHTHVFLGDDHSRYEKRTWIVVALTATMMVGEIVGGTVFGSMALVADGWHMSTHATALTIAALAYLFARRHSHDERFTLGTGKFGDLAAFASAIILAIVAVLIGYELVLRLLQPVAIRFPEAMLIAALGLAVNLFSAWMLAGDHDHHHTSGELHAHGHEHAHIHDHNLRAAYIHVLADALTSVLAICGLFAASQFGWLWIDPVVGLIGTLVILSWAFGLIRSAGSVLLDAIPDTHLAEHIRGRIEVDGDRLSDLHLWRVGPGHTAVIFSVVSHAPQPPLIYKSRLKGIHGLSHITVETHLCEEK